MSDIHTMPACYHLYYASIYDEGPISNINFCLCQRGQISNKYTCRNVCMYARVQKYYSNMLWCCGIIYSY